MDGVNIKGAREVLTLSTLVYDLSMRTSYHHGNLREALLETACELARSNGPDGVGLREVARRAGVSHNAAYRHFEDRGALLGAVADVGMEELAASMQARLEKVRTRDSVQASLDRLRAIGHAYVDFAIDEWGLFEVAFGGFEIDKHEGLPPEGNGPFDLLNAVLDECVAAGAIPATNRPGAEVTCWAAVHGFAVLHQRGPLRDTKPADRDALLDLMIDRLEGGLSIRN